MKLLKFQLAIAGAAAAAALATLGGTLLFLRGTSISAGPVSTSDRQPVIKQVEMLAELTTVKVNSEVTVISKRPYTINAPIIGEKQIGEDQVIMSVRGTVKAGVDLSNLETKIKQTPNGAVLTLPPPTLHSVEVNTKNSKVLDTNLSVFTPIEQIPELQSVALDQGRLQLIQFACDNQILEDANRQAKLALSTIPNLTIEVSPPQKCEYNN